MHIDWTLVAIIAAPILTLFVGAALDRLIEQHPRLVAYFLHVSAFTLSSPAGTVVHTHSVVIKNTGRRSAEDVRITHKILPDNFNVFPATEYSRHDLPGGGAEIRIPAMVPGEEIMLSYLYFPPVTAAHINGPIKHSEGCARGITVLPTPQAGKWARRIAGTLMLSGAIALVYAFVQLAIAVFSN